MTEESNAWVFDSLIGFLHGPVWNAPLQTFIEEESLSKISFYVISVGFFTDLLTFFLIHTSVCSTTDIVFN